MICRLFCEEILCPMEKIIDTVGDALKETVEGGRASFQEEFKKAQENILKRFPTPDHFKKLMEQMKDMTKEQKEKLLSNLADGALNPDKIKEMFSNKRKAPAANYYDYLVFIGMVLLVVVVIGESFAYFISKCPVEGQGVTQAKIMRW